MSLIATEALLQQIPRQKFVGLQKATVTNDFDPVTDVSVTMDSDSKPSSVMSLIGELQQGQRVMVVFIEPNAAYIAWALAPPAWRPLDLHLGWLPAGTVSFETYADPAIRRVGDEVQVRGVIEQVGVDRTIADLPEGFRPGKSEGFASDSAGGHAGVYALASDNSLYYNGGAAPPFYLTLSSVRFSVTPDP